ncbi:quinone oxidoreductase family protein [Halotia branconii]|uniref:Zinc-binding alcohol dehydrogenase family protein n=1 Tax=Halotia branconii CENA392 TaxID=1539056 RepID=A0AAJ6NV23_9CYAN|nr:zinc-binding alcohol dehydrogenase family protein [Halotia branconii]WGV27152.1 zinc-binding alcohol dehydrogenase family protein [Halotia branconii CENA392]
MKNVSICGSQLQHLMPFPNIVQAMQIEGVDVFCGLIHTEDPQFDVNAPENIQKVLVKKRAFSCNYRDKNLILKTAVNAPKDCFYTVGSDFVGEVVAVGAEVSEFQVGDRVIGNNSYPDSGVVGLLPGVPTNNASKEYQSFHQAKLLKIPPKMSDESAAAFSIGGQTAYSMIRKLNIQPGANVLVTAAKSNTSLFAINALKQYKVNLYATSTSMRFAQELKDMGVKQLIRVNQEDDDWLASAQMREVYDETGGFNYIIDPFFDLHLGKVISLFVPRAGGKYITCGFYDQYSQFTGKEFQYYGLPCNQILVNMMVNNIHLIGNCVGTTEDLQRAIQDCANGNFSVAIDSVFQGDRIKEFFERTYNAKDRFGKVIYRYE